MEEEQSFLVNRDLQKQYSFDDCIYRQKLRRTAGESIKIRRTKSERKRKNRTSSRTLQVLCQVKPNIMYKLTWKTPSPDITKLYNVDIKGAHCTRLCTPKECEKSQKVFFNSPDPTGKDVEAAEIIVTEGKKAIEHFTFAEVLKSQDTSALKCNQMNLTTSKPERTLPDIRLFNNDEGFLCEKEEKFLQTRKLYIHGALKRIFQMNAKENSFEMSPEDVPHIALMGSGGGYRAMVAMSGIFNALYDTHLLDCILYTAVLSGSSWYIATLYSHPDWPGVDPKIIQEKIKDDISKDPKYWKIFFRYAPGYFVKKCLFQQCNFTLDVFAHWLGSNLIGDRLGSKWSDQADKLSEGTVPLPLLSAIHAKSRENARKCHEWLEFSPFEASIPTYGAAISMKHLGSEFLKGQLIQETELPLYKIMGICGSAYALTYEELKEKESVLTSEHEDLPDKNRGNEPRLYSKAKYETNTSKPKTEISSDSGRDKPDGRLETEIKTNRKNSECNKDEKCNKNGLTDVFDEIDGPPHCKNRNDNGLVDNYEKTNDSFHLLGGCSYPQIDHNTSNDCYKFDEIDDILNFKFYQDECHQPTDEDMEYLKSMFSQFCKIPDDVFDRADQSGNSGIDELDGLTIPIPEVIKKRCLKSRDTFQRAAVINNFMRKVSFDEFDGPAQNSILFENYLKNEDMQELRLIDAGLAFNSPYPLLFKHGRDIDLILSFDFTDRKADKESPFKTILEAEEWAKTHNIKFPRIKDSIQKYEGKEIQELYVFEEENDQDCPIIMHFVLVNINFRHYKKPDVKWEESKKRFADFNIYDDQSTFHCMNFHYSHENFERLSQLSEFIVLNNKEEIKKCIEKSTSNKIGRLTKMRRSRHKTC